MTPEEILLGLASVLVLGVTAQWLAWRFDLPSILFLLFFGFIVGPITGFLDPDELFGDLLLPLVSLSVGVILFEGGLTLKIDEVRAVRRVVRHLLSIGVVVTIIGVAAASYLILQLDLELSLLLGAILSVTGPTVIGPLLRQVRPNAQVASILRWEGIIIDPIGAIAAVLVFEAVFATDVSHAATETILTLVRAVAIGSIFGVVGAAIIMVLIIRHWLPEYLENPVSLMMVVGAFALSNVLQEESGLLTTTVMGIVLANQKRVKITNIASFKEEIGILLISGLFILLASRLQISNLEQIIDLRHLAFLAVIMLIVRPAGVFLSTIGSNLTRNERLFIAWLAPRGIVAAAVSSVFAFELTHIDHAQAENLVPVTFLVIIGTVAIYGLTAAPFAKLLKISHENPQGVLIVGGHFWAQMIAEVLHQQGFPVLIVDTNYAHISQSRMRGLRTYYGSALSERILNDIDLEGIGRLMALTSNDEVNSLAAMRFAEIFGHENVYQLRPAQRENAREENVSDELAGRVLFSGTQIHTDYTRRFISGAVIKATQFTDTFAMTDFRDLYGYTALPLFLIKPDGRLLIATDHFQLNPEAGDTLISLIDPIEEAEPLEDSA
ncbi:MAG: hypothetical protein D6737_19810 [Chloroflexi bacterium]|nr:MAG: hypothetical protein D6737_19810 [Chloroflexota bacterium]